MRGRGRPPMIRLRALMCFDEMDEMVRAGKRPGEIADFVRSKGEYTDVTKKTLVRMISKYRRLIEAGHKIKKIPLPPEGLREQIQMLAGKCGYR